MNSAHNFVLKAVILFAALLIVNYQSARADTPIDAAVLLQQYRLSEAVVSPDGQRVAIVVTEPIEGDQKRSSIWLYERTSNVFRRLTTAGKIDSSPRWATMRSQSRMQDTCRPIDAKTWG